MKIALTTIWVLLLFSSGITFAQQDPQFTFYKYNMNIINPAHVGSSDGVALALALRSQWAGVEGAPESQSAMFGMPLGEKVGFGVSLLNDKTFIESQLWVGIDVSYNIRIDDNNVLYFGIKGSANSYDANTQGLISYGVGQDASLMDYESKITPNIGAGVYLKNKRYFVSLSVPKLLTPDRLQEKNGSAYLGTDKLHGYLSGGYDFVFSKSVTLQTMGMLRYVEAAPLSYELTGIVDFGSRFSLGASYRYNESFSGLFLFKIREGFHIGYAYENAIEKPVEGIDNGTHELFMRIKL